MAAKGLCLILQTLLFDILNTLRRQMGVEIGGVRTSKEHKGEEVHHPDSEVGEHEVSSGHESAFAGCAVECQELTPPPKKED